MDVDSVFPVMSALRITEHVSSQNTVNSSQESSQDATVAAATSSSKILVAVCTKNSGNLYVAVLPSCIGSHQPQGMECDEVEVGPRELQWQQMGGTGKGKLEW